MASTCATAAAAISSTPRPLPDRKLNRHAPWIDCLGIKSNQFAQPLARGNAVEFGVLRNGGDTSLRPTFQDGGKQRATVGESSVETAFGYSEILSQHFDAHLLDAAARQRRKGGLDPLCAAVVIGHDGATRLIRHRIDSAWPL